jgi:hypothetical protein
MLERELAYFEANRQRFCELYAGQYVLIHGEQFLGTYSTDALAYEAGLQKMGNVPFLIKCAMPTDVEAFVPAYSLGILRPNANI